ncbi:MAG: tyrosine-protein kinase domain-containing protein [Thermoleophilia bacterium]
MTNSTPDTSALYESPPDALETVELADYLRVVRERWLVVVVAVVVVLAAALFVSLRTTPLYKSTAVLVRDANQATDTIFGNYVYRDVERELQTAAATVATEEVAGFAQAALGSGSGSGLAPADLLGMISAQPQQNADILRLEAVSTDPAEAAAVANAFATGFIEGRKEKQKEAIALASRVVQGQLDRLTEVDLATNRGVYFRQRLEELSIIGELQTGGYVLTQPATAAAGPFTPQPLRDSILALAVGLVLGVGLAFLLEYLDRRIKSEEEMERQFGLPVLTTVPVVGREWGGDSRTARRRGNGRRSGTARRSAAVGFMDANARLVEPFRTLRSNLRFFETERDSQGLLITSALPNEGKTVTTANLALSLAMMGNSVLVIEADMRRPMVHNYLGLPNDVGLSTVLAGASVLDDVLRPVRVGAFAPADGFPSRNGAAAERSGERGSLHVLTSGPAPPNPTELLGSTRMLELLYETRKRFQYVLVDSPPILMVADALVLAPRVGAVLLATRLFSTTRDEAQRTRALVERSGGEVRIIGLVAGGARPGRSYYGRYGYYAGYSDYDTPRRAPART